MKHIDFEDLDINKKHSKEIVSIMKNGFLKALISHYKKVAQAKNEKLKADKDVLYIVR